MPKSTHNTNRRTNTHPLDPFERQRRKDAKAIIKGFPKQRSFAFRVLFVPVIQERVLNYLVSYEVRIESEGAKAYVSRYQKDLVAMSLTCKAFWWNAMKVKWRELVDLEPLLNLWHGIGMLTRNAERWNTWLCREPQQVDWTTIYRYMSQLHTLRFLREPNQGTLRHPEMILLVRQLYNAAKERKQDQILCNVSDTIGLLPRLFPSLRTLEWECIAPTDLQCLGMVVLASPEIVRVAVDIPDLSHAPPEVRRIWDRHLFFLLEFIFVHAKSIQELEIHRLPIVNPDPHLEEETSTAAITRYVLRASGLRHLVLPAEAMDCHILFTICCLSNSLQSLQFVPLTTTFLPITVVPPGYQSLSTEHTNLKHISATTRIIPALLNSPGGICADLEQLFLVDDPNAPTLPVRALPGALAFFAIRFPALKTLWLKITLTPQEGLPVEYPNALRRTPSKRRRENSFLLAGLLGLEGVEEVHVELTIVGKTPGSPPIIPLDFILTDYDWQQIAKSWPKLRRLWYSCLPLETTFTNEATIHRVPAHPPPSSTTDYHLASRFATVQSILVLLSACQHLQSVTIPFTCRQRDCEMRDYLHQAVLLPERLRQRGQDGLEIGLGFADVDVPAHNITGVARFWSFLTWGIKDAKFTGIAPSVLATTGWSEGVLCGNAQDLRVTNDEIRRCMKWRGILDWVEKSKLNAQGGFSSTTPISA